MSNSSEELPDREFRGVLKSMSMTSNDIRDPILNITPTPFSRQDINRAVTLPKEKEKCARYAPMSILCFVLIFLYTTFLLGYLPGYVREDSTLTVPGYAKNIDPYGVVVNNIQHHRIVTLILSGLYVMVLVNFCLCHFTRSGDVPNAWPWVTDDWLKKYPTSPAAIAENLGENRDRIPNRGYERKRSGKERKCRWV